MTGRTFQAVPFPSFILAAFLYHSLRGGRTRKWGGEEREEVGFLPLFSFLCHFFFSLSSCLSLYHFPCPLEKGNLVQVDARPEKFSYFARSSLSALGKEECQIALLLHQGTAF